MSSDLTVSADAAPEYEAECLLPAAPASVREARSMVRRRPSCLVSRGRHPVRSRSLVASQTSRITSDSFGRSR